MSVCIPKIEDSFEPHYCDQDQTDQISNNIEYYVNKKKSAFSRKGVIAILPAFNEELSIGSMVLHAKEYAERVAFSPAGCSLSIRSRAVSSPIMRSRAISPGRDRTGGGFRKTG